MDKELLVKQEKLFLNLQKMENSVIAYSGGVDSALLACVAKKMLGNKVVAITAVSSTLTKQERLEAQKVAKEIGIEHIELMLEEMDVQEFVNNDFKRCYYCKKYRLELLSEWANKNNYKWILEGSNFDDDLDYRPGMKALQEFDQVRSPLKETGLTKQEVRQLAKEIGLSVWDKPSLPCLATRINYGLAITKERLQQVEKAEQIVKRYLSAKNVRVRHHGNIARIEIDKECFPILSQVNVISSIDLEIKKIGFSFVSLDLAGFASGSLNKVLNKK